MVQATQSERIEMRVDAETKKMAERASVVLGCSSLTEFMTRLIRENAPKILEEKASIQLTNSQFDNFLDICNNTERLPDDRIMAAAKRLDKDGF